MSSSKSAQLLMNAYSFEERGIPFLCIKPSIDNRDGDGVISSRAGMSRECVSIDTDIDVFEFMKNYIDKVSFAGLDKPKWVLVDESQFLTSKQVYELSDVVDYLDINVICYGLRTDFLCRMFDGSKTLMEIADDINELKVSCKCGRKAVVNARIDSDGNVVVDGDRIVIGGNDMYMSVCRKCYKEMAAKANGNCDRNEYVELDVN
ncbi:MAG: thymidine kinase [Paludibacteraceae bacterium]|nr:thymidine kinase [Paludibacteraceae bacterium]